MNSPQPVVDFTAEQVNASADGTALAARYDVVILGGGLAGLSLARHLLLKTNKSVLLLERRDLLPQKRQKVGESSVQLAGYYFSRVLELEEYLFLHHFMKYNLRFYWKTPGAGNQRFEEYSQSYIRPFSNIASYQLDRNTFEAELLRRNLQNPRFTARLGVQQLQVDLDRGSSPADPDQDHELRFRLGDPQKTYSGGPETDAPEYEVAAGWVVDTTGRRKLLAKQEKLTRDNSIDHAAFFWWVDGLVDVDRLTDASSDEIRKKPQRRHQGHLPAWLATNHFMDEGLWFWVIPLQGKTSLGLVFDKAVVDYRDVFTVDKATAWVCERFPCFAHDLPRRNVVDFGGYKDFSYDCEQTLHPRRWALAGEAGRFSDPLYSPGSDLISVYNTLIVDAIETDTTDQAGRQRLADKCSLSEQLMRGVYAAYEPTYTVSYDALGDQEAFSLKYTWELTVYFAYYVFPFINDLLTDRRFALGWLRRFARLGPTNHGVQRLLSGFFQWKSERAHPGAGRGEPCFFDFMDLAPLRRAETTFYEVGVDADEARRVLDAQLTSLEEFARFLAAHVASVVLERPELRSDAGFVASLDLDALDFMPETWAALAVDHADGRAHAWQLDPTVLDRFRST